MQEISGDGAWSFCARGGGVVIKAELTVEPFRERPLQLERPFCKTEERLEF